MQIQSYELPKIPAKRISVITTRAQLRRVCTERTHLRRARDLLRRQITMSLGQTTEDRVAAVDRELEEYERLIQEYWKGYSETKQIPSDSLTDSDADLLSSIDELASTLIRVRVRKRIQQTKVAEMLHITNGQYCRYEQTQFTKVSLERLLAIARILRSL